MEEALHTDGNAAAGLFQEIFVAEMTSARRVCNSCGQENPIAEHRAYSGAGTVLRCPACGDVAASVAELESEYVIALYGAWRLAKAS
jgi:predicted RNA-binding Zn-ribbon protein involved in translation (DUF1610 family)